MDFEERERQRRRQMIGVVFAEVGMFFAVIVIVVVATLAAMGFFVTPEGTIEQAGLIQIRSTPTGGIVELDGGVLFSKTNLTRSLTAGDHSLKISRDNYDSWEKVVKMYSGMLIRLYYPRLFLKDRVPENVERLGQELEFFVPSEDYSYILYAEKSSTEWHLVNIRGDEVRNSSLDVSEVLSTIGRSTFAGEITYFKWSKNSDRVLIQVKNEDAKEWIVVDLRDVKKSLNLTRTFGLDFTQVEMIDDSAAQLYALENRQLRKINIADQSVSRVLLSEVDSFMANGASIIYTMQNHASEEKMIGVYKDGERGGTTIMRAGADDRIKVALARYYDEDYMVIVINDALTIYYGTLPSYRENVAETDFLNFKTLLDSVKISIVPDGINVSEKGEYLAMHNGKKFAVVDFEMGDLHEYEAEIGQIRWLNEGMMFSTKEGDLKVWDFDYTNRRTLVEFGAEAAVDSGDEDEVTEEKVASATTTSRYSVADYAATISYNNKWLYYVVDNNGELVLVREKVRD